MVAIRSNLTRAMAVGIALLMGGALSTTGAEVTYGSATASTPYHNLFGWRIGQVDVSWAYVCSGCTCQFVGAPTVSETLPIQECSVVNMSTTPHNCGASAGCPGGVLGQKVVLVIECCIEYLELPFCASHQETMTACP